MTELAVTVDQFLAWAPAQPGAWQLVDGEPQLMAPATDRHGRIQAELARLLGNHLVERRPGCTVVTEPGLIPELNASHNFRVPDLAVTCSPEQAGSWVVPDPLLIVEILSPGNRSQTWVNVWSFTSIPSVREIVVIHTDAIRAAVLRREADGAWPDQARTVEGGDVLNLASIELSLPLGDVCRTTLLATAATGPGVTGPAPPL